MIRDTIEQPQIHRWSQGLDRVWTAYTNRTLKTWNLVKRRKKNIENVLLEWAASILCSLWGMGKFMACSLNASKWPKRNLQNFWFGFPSFQMLDLHLQQAAPGVALGVCFQRYTLCWEAAQVHQDPLCGLSLVVTQSHEHNHRAQAVMWGLPQGGLGTSWSLLLQWAPRVGVWVGVWNCLGTQNALAPASKWLWPVVLLWCHSHFCEISQSFQMVSVLKRELPLSLRKLSSFEGWLYKSLAQCWLDVFIAQ